MSSVESYRVTLCVVLDEDAVIPGGSAAKAALRPRSTSVDNGRDRLITQLNVQYERYLRWPAFKAVSVEFISCEITKDGSPSTLTRSPAVPIEASGKDRDRGSLYDLIPWLQEIVERHAPIRVITADEATAIAD